MASYETITILKHLNPGNFVDSKFDTDHREYVVCFKTSDIKLPDSCFIAHNRIYDADEDIKICRIVLQSY